EKRWIQREWRKMASLRRGRRLALLAVCLAAPAPRLVISGALNAGISSRQLWIAAEVVIQPRRLARGQPPLEIDVDKLDQHRQPNPLRGVLREKLIDGRTAAASIGVF